MREVLITDRVRTGRAAVLWRDSDVVWSETQATPTLPMAEEANEPDHERSYMNDHPTHSPASIVGRILGYVLAWLGSWKLGDVQALAGIVSALAVGGLAALNAYVLWRDRIRGRQQGEGQ